RAFEIGREKIALHQRRRVLVGAGEFTLGGIGLRQQRIQPFRNVRRIPRTARDIGNAIRRMKGRVGGVEAVGGFRHGIVVGRLGARCEDNSRQDRDRKFHARDFRRSRISRSSTTSSGGGGGVASAGSGLVCRRLMPRMSANNASATTRKLMMALIKMP